jgi:hypothetical protein
MNWKKILIIAASVVLGIIALSAAGLAIWSATGTYPAGDVAREAMESGSTVEVAVDSFIRFLPRDVSADVGLVFYPGGLVDPTAYAPVLRRIAEEGYPVFITPMPLNLGIFKTGAADEVFEAYPDIDRWILAGHSLGGASAGIYAAANPEAIDALVFWDSYPPGSSDLSEEDIPVLSIYGTSGGVPNTPNFDEQRSLQPADTEFVPIEGASHAQFGDYGPQSGDVEPQISLAEQHDAVFRIMMDFIRENIR